jgi:hypothetical protein
MKKKTYKTDWKLLRWVAEHSPKEFAKKILVRNQELLKAFKAKNWGFESYVGCPHCEGCTNCLWVKGIKKLGDSTVDSLPSKCTWIMFGGICLNDCLMIEYQPDSERLNEPVGLCDKDIAEERRFLEAHIEWAKKPYWGKKLKK